MTENIKKQRLRVAVYSRVASKVDATPQSYETRIKNSKAYIEKQPNWELCGVYCDDGISGMKAHRPALDKLLNACRAGEIDIVLTDSFPSLGRNTTAVLQLVQDLKALGVDIVLRDSGRRL